MVVVEEEVKVVEVVMVVVEEEVKVAEVVMVVVEEEVKVAEVVMVVVEEEVKVAEVVMVVEEEVWCRRCKGVGGGGASGETCQVETFELFYGSSAVVMTSDGTCGTAGQRRAEPLSNMEFWICLIFMVLDPSWNNSCLYSYFPLDNPSFYSNPPLDNSSFYSNPACHNTSFYSNPPWDNSYFDSYSPLDKPTLYTTTLTTTTPLGRTTTSTPLTTTPLVCDNGGQSLNGVCICPDEWTGETCSVENFCDTQYLEGFTFERTPISWFAYSKEVCPKGTSNVGKPKASTRCTFQPSGSPSFNHHPQILKCDQTLSDIQQNLTSPADLETLATSTQILTSKPEELTAENFTAAAEIANTLLLSPNASESVKVAAVATVSQLLIASSPDITITEESNATVGLTRTLDQLSISLSANLNSAQSQVVQPNLVVQSAQIPAANTQGVQFSCLAGTSGSFVANRIQLNTNTSSVEVENGLISDALIFLRFPPETSRHQRLSNVSLGFVLYQNDRFFRSQLYRSRSTVIRVLSASIGGQEHGVVPQHVEMLFRPTLMESSSLHDFACVFWNYSLGDWSTDGCSKGKSSDRHLQCFCNHTTNFAALLSFRVKYEYAMALDTISICGLSFSIFGLVVTILHHFRENFWRSARNHHGNNNFSITLLSISVSLLAFIITFLSGVQNNSRDGQQPEIDIKTNIIFDSDKHVEPDRGSCSAVAALLQFFLLSTFAWNSIHGTQLALLVRTVRVRLPSYWTPVSFATGLGVPAVIVAITLGTTYRVDNPLGYRQEEFCWLSGLDEHKRFDFGKPMFWGFLLPVGLILIYNWVLLVLISVETCMRNRKINSTKRWSFLKRFLISFSLAILLGLSWTLGYLVLTTTGHAHLIFSILFCICTTTQGFQIFILFTARRKSFRSAMKHSMQYVSSVSIQLQNTKYSLRKYRGKTNSTGSYKDLTDHFKSSSNSL
ncbi:adhesion G-protein coupled receptor G7 [Aulostomus maculatus]